MNDPPSQAGIIKGLNYIQPSDTDQQNIMYYYMHYWSKLYHIEAAKNLE